MNQSENIHLEFFGVSDIGMVRSENQDSYGKYPNDSNDWNQPKGLLFIVADGMGGHVGGKEASNSAVDIVSREYYSFSSDIVSNCLNYAIKTANFRIYQSSKSDIQSHRKGTTCSALVLEKNLAYIAHVGDSRIYRIRKDKIEQLTQDHTQVEEMLRKGILSKEEAKSHPSKSILVRALGIESEVEVDVIENIKLVPGDNFLLCSDGLAKINPEEIKGIVLSNTPEEAAKELIRLANERGGHDNVTVQIVSIKSNDLNVSSPTHENNNRSKFLLNRKLYIIIISIIVLLIIIAMIFNQNLTALFSSNSTNVVNDKDVITVEKSLDPQEQLMEKAESYLSYGKTDSAAILYKLVLKDNPMHLGALDGIDIVSSEYLKQGNIQKQNKDYGEALYYYQKASDLKPADKEITGLIALTKMEMNKDAAIQRNNNNGAEITGIDEKKPENISENSDVLFASFIPSEWIFRGLNENDYVITSNQLTYLRSSKNKIGLYNQEIADVDVNVNLSIPENSIVGNSGIVIGYNEESKNSTQTYFIFSVDVKGNYYLIRKIGDLEENLISGYQKVTPVQNEYTFVLKIKSLGPWIMIYNGDKLLDSWLGKDFVKGKLGLFSEGGIRVNYSDFKVTTAFENKEKNKSN